MKNKKTYIYLLTGSGAKTNITSDIKILDTEGLTKLIKGTSKFNGRIRYGSIGNYTSLLNTMSLEEFEEDFKDAGFTPDQITHYFNRNISMKYGKHAIQKTIPALPAKEIKRGYIYEDVTGGKWLYLGMVNVKEIFDPNRSLYNSDKSGHGYYSMWGEEGREIPLTSFKGCHILKNRKKLVKEVGKYEHTIPAVYEYRDNGNNWRDPRNHTFKLL